MPHGNKKTYMMPKCTGTIPKVKQRNNNNAGGGAASERRSNLVSNNLGNEFEAGANRGNRNRNHNRNLHYYHMMDVQENGAPNGTFSSNGTVTSNESNSLSRRNSSGLSKCDNVTKYPDKKQIETKLSQIKEYLQVATAMKTNMKNTDEQVQSIAMQSSDTVNDEQLDDEQLDAIINDLTDSASKLQMILAEIEGTEQSEQFSDGSEHIDPEIIRQNKNELERKVDVATRDLQMIKEQENYLLQLQLNAEKQLREARFAQAKLAKSARNTNSETEWCNDSDSLSMSGASSGRNMDFRDLEDRIKSFNIDDGKTPCPEQFQGQIDHLQNHIQQMRESNDNRSQLIQMLDTRDAQLQAQHNSLQGKLQELQNKKHQVDQLVVQLQTMSHNDESEEDEMGCHVKKIVNMKEQLTKLKDMLDLVQDTEDSIGTHAQNAEIEENVSRLIAKTDNLMQQNRVPHVENIENASARSNYPSNEKRVKEKQVNKQSMNAHEKERIKLQQELRAKRSELEELMCKHKAANSNLNHDVNSEKNSEMGASSNTNFEIAANAWYPIDSNLFNTHTTKQEPSSESDDCPEEDPNEFSIHSPAAVQPMPAYNYPTANYIRNQSQEPPSPRVEMPHEYVPHVRSPARMVRSVTPMFAPNETAANRSQQIQKQLELIKTVCDSMLEQNNENNEQTAPVRVRNNLTPSPIYSEPRHSSPRQNLRPASSANALNVVNYPEQTLQMPPNFSPNDATAYNNWLTTNSLQTQAFILNTLNQCCQMLWHQQKELSTLRNSVNVMQDRFGNVYHDEAAMCMQSNPCLYQPNLPPANYMTNNYRQPMKTQMPTSHPQSVNSGSMPNLNGHCAHPSPAANNATNMEHAFCNNMMPNNASAPPVHQHQNTIGEHQLNTNHIMHANPNAPAPIWHGQALNNQVPPGNRANNYWDNFRSYSRQNLFSTKSNDGTQNLFNERSNQSERRSMNGNQEMVSSTSSGVGSLLAKTNSNLNEVMSTSAENSPRRISVPKRRVVSTSLPGTSSDRTAERQAKPTNNEGAFSLPRIDSAFSVHTLPDDVATNHNTRNGENWRMGANVSQKSKLFEDLRENVYKEVASLISANEDRPHFLIQLFQDLQLISTDPLRRNVLQSVQTLITSSLSNSANSSRQHQNDMEPPRQNEKYSSEATGNEYDLLPLQHEASVTTSDGNISDIAPETQNERQRTPVMWPMMPKHSLGSLINEQDNQESYHESMSSYITLRQDESAYLDVHITDDEILRLQILEQNGDLAEADQSCAAEDDDEGAVGGLLNLLERSASSNAGQIHLGEELNLETEEDEGEQGLDQVPTRLSNPPSIGCSPKSH